LANDRKGLRPNRVSERYDASPVNRNRDGANWIRKGLSRNRKGL
jgi:hypothetical protein